MDSVVTIVVALNSSFGFYKMDTLYTSHTHLNIKITVYNKLLAISINPYK